MSNPPSSPTQLASPKNRVSEETLLARFDIDHFEQAQLENIRVSPDNKHIAFINRIDDKLQVFVDQQPGEIFPAIMKGTLTFSPDSRRFAYAASTDDRSFMVIDHEKSMPYDNILNCSPAFSPDSEHLAYAARSETKIIVYVDKESVGAYEFVGNALVYSPDSRRLAYRAGLGRRQCIVSDGKVGPFYDQVDNPVFSPDSQHIAYPAEDGDGWFIVVDGQEGTRVKDAIGPLFSPDSQQVTYYAKQYDGWYLALGEQFMGPFQSVGRRGFPFRKFSPNSQHFVFAATEAKKFLSFNYGQRVFLVIDGEPQERFQSCVNFEFSPDSRRLAYWVRQDDRWRIVVDDKTYGPYDTIDALSPVFSPDSQHFSYAAKTTSKTSSAYSPYVDGMALGAFQETATPVFSPDGSSVAFLMSEIKHGTAQVVINGRPGKKYGALLTIGGGRIAFDSPNRLHYIANGSDKPDHWYLVTESFLPRCSGQV